MAIELDELAGPEGGDESRRLAKHWLDQINSIKDNTEMKRWRTRAEKIEKRYRDERNRADEEGVRRYNSLWANVEILKPALYGRPPLPVAERRFKDKDPVGRGAAQILERALRNELEICGFDEALSQAVGDYLLPGRGTVWIRYEPEIEESISLPPETQDDMRDAQGAITSEAEDTTTETTAKGRERARLRPEGGEQKPPENIAESEEKLRSTGDRVVRESTPVDFVQWPDFFTFPVRARVWKEVTAVGKRVYMSRDQMVRRFKKRIGKHIPLNKDDRGQKQVQNTSALPSDEDKGQIYEIWNKDDETVYWVAMGYDYLCDRKDDPLGLENFFPCPQPLYANATNNTLTPVPDYIQYQDQAMQIDDLTQRISMLTKACKMVGVYNAAAKDVQRMFEEGVENQLIPVDDWAAFSGDKGGVAGNISVLPVQDVINIINELMMAKAKQVEEMDRLTGITDIMRGTTDARETLGGQRLKSNSSGTRLTRRQNDVARFARDTVRIMADIMCQHFSPKSLIEVSGALYEEGLGPDDLPPLNELQNGIQPPQGGTPPAMPPPQPPQPQTAPGGMPGAGGMAGGGQPPPPMGQNVIPFRPPAAPAPQMPPQAPQGLNGQVMPPIPPEMLAKFKALKRIADAIKLLRDERLRGFRVDIEVDSTIYADAAEDKAERTEFIIGVTGFLEKSAALGAQIPEAIPLLGKMLQFGARGQRIGRDLELAIEEFVDKGPEIVKRLQSQQGQNPEMIKAQAQQALAQAKVQSEQSRIQSDKIKQQGDAQKNQFDMQAAQLEAHTEQQQAAAEVSRQQLENEGERANAAADLQMKQADVEMKLIEKRIEEMRLQLELRKMALEEQQSLRDDKLKKQEMKHEKAQADREGEQSELEMDHEKAQAKMEHSQTKLEMKHEKEQTLRDAELERAKAKSAAAKAKATK